MLSHLLALSASALWGVADFGGGALTRRLPAVVVVLTSQAAAALLLTIGVVATGAASDLPGSLWYAAAAGVIGPFAMLAFYRALALGPMGVVSPLATVGVAVPVGLGLVLGDRPGVGQVAGIAVAVLGVTLAGGPGTGGGAVRMRVLTLALGAAFGFGSVMALITQASTGGGLLLALCVQRVCNTMAGGALLAARPRGRERVTAAELRRSLPVLTGIGVADVAANATYVLASHSGSVAVAAVLASLYPVVTALMASGLMKERLRPMQLVGSGLAVAGTLLLAAG